MKQKSRLDKVLVSRNLVPSRERAQAHIIAGNVLVNDRCIDKPGSLVANDAEIRLRGADHPYVSRGGLKLEKALEAFNIDVRNRIAMDVGASTGGFTDCLLKHGAAFVYAIDVGYSQLDWKLMTNDRVRNLEKTNFRYLSMLEIGTFVDFVAIDVSFISLTKILTNCLTFLCSGGQVVALIKPQFEAGRRHIGKGGVVVDSEVRSRTVDEVSRHAESLSFSVKQVGLSPIQGKKSGNIEYLMHLEKPL